MINYIEYETQEQLDMIMIVELIREIEIQVHKEKHDKIIETSDESKN